MLTGSRYELSGQELPTLLPWIRGVMDLKLDPQDIHQSQYPTRLPEPVMNQAALADLQKIFTAGALSFDPEVRLRHGHGHTQWEMYQIKYGHLSRVPDLVVYPSREDEVVELVQLAQKFNLCLIPYGGGTSVTEALLCPDNETRMIISVDMQRLNQILWIDPVNRLAHIQAGAVGRHLASQLQKHGFTMGHEPDSVEFSTLGGWIATHASGMKKNKYGNIEDLVLDVQVVTADGLLTRNLVGPRESVGIDPRLLLFGSEGSFGIITSAIVKLFPLPEVQKYGSILFPDFAQGVNFMYALAQTGRAPASIRLVDNLQFQFGMALKPRSQGLKALKSKIEKFIVTKIKKFDPQHMVACTLVFEGLAGEVDLQEKRVYQLAGKFGGMRAGAENGKKGYQLTFGIAYIRDFVMRHFILAESFETSVAWSQALDLCRNVKARLWHEHQKRQLPGKPFITCRVTQIYDTGVCIYFYYGFYHKGLENPSELYAELERAAREEILKSGGALSHHHGIGKIREPFLKQIKSPAMLEWNQRTKAALDPQNIFGAGNQGLKGKQCIAINKQYPIFNNQ